MAARVTALLVIAIVAVTLIAGLIVGAQRDTLEGPVDLIVLNGKVFTADGTGAVAEALAIRGNQILRVGSNREIKRLRRRQTMIVDAHGGSVLPGFNDSYVHFIDGGRSLEEIDLSLVQTVDQVADRIRAFADSNPDGRWIRGRGWLPEAFPNGQPTRELLDTLVPDRPAHMLAHDGRMLWVNSKALEIAGITRHTTSPKNGAIVKDPKTGEPTGLLEDAAIRLVDDQLPEVSRLDRQRALRTAVHEAQRLGITSVQDATARMDDLMLYDEARQTGDLQVRVYATVGVPESLDSARLDALDTVLKKYPDDPLFKTGAASLNIPAETDPPPSGRASAPKKAKPAADATPVDDLAQTIRTLDRREWQIIVRATDEGGVKAAREAFASALAANPPPPRGRRHRVELRPAVDLTGGSPLASLATTASLQPVSFDATQPSELAAAEKTASAQNVPAPVHHGPDDVAGYLAFGSGWPLAPWDPRAALDATMNTSAAADDADAPATSPDRALPLGRLIEAYTSGAAWASFDEKRKGTLAPGMLADVVILSADVFALPPSRLLDAVVTTTIFDGKIVYARDTGSN